MKALIKIVLYSFILLSINCTSKQSDSDTITLEQLAVKKNSDRKLYKYVYLLRKSWL